MTPAEIEGKGAVRRERQRVLPYRRVPPLLMKSTVQAPPDFQGRFRSRKERASELQLRMDAFSRVRNSCWHVRAAYFGPDERLRRAVLELFAVVLAELPETTDYEALLFALVDALASSPTGCPWEA